MHKITLRFKLIIIILKIIINGISIKRLRVTPSIVLIYINPLTTSVNAIIAWVIYSIAVFFNILYSYFTSFLRGVGAIAESNKAATISKLSQLLLTFVMFVLGYGLIGVTISYLVSGLIIRITSRYYFFRYDNVKEILNKRDAEVNLGNCIEMFRSVWHNASKEGLIMISNYLSTQANTLICSSVLGLTSTGFYGLAIQITTLISNIASIPFSSYQVSLQEDAVTNNMERSRKTFSAVMVAFIGAYLVLAVFTFVSIPIIEIIKPNMIFDKWMFSTMLILFFIHQFYHLNSSFISTRNTLPYTKAFLFSSLISVCLSLFLSKYTNIGLWGLIISPLIISVSYNAWKWPTVALSYLGEISMCEFIQLGWNTLNDIVKNKSFRKKKTL